MYQGREDKLWQCIMTDVTMSLSNCIGHICCFSILWIWAWSEPSSTSNMITFLCATRSLCLSVSDVIWKVFVLLSDEGTKSLTYVSTLVHWVVVTWELIIIFSLSGSGLPPLQLLFSSACGSWTLGDSSWHGGLPASQPNSKAHHSLLTFH